MSQQEVLRRQIQQQQPKLSEYLSEMSPTNPKPQYRSPIEAPPPPRGGGRAGGEPSSMVTQYLLRQRGYGGALQEVGGGNLLRGGLLRWC